MNAIADQHEVTLHYNMQRERKAHELAIVSLPTSEVAPFIAAIEPAEIRWQTAPIAWRPTVGAVNSSPRRYMTCMAASDGALLPKKLTVRFTDQGTGLSPAANLLAGWTSDIRVLDERPEKNVQHNQLDLTYSACSTGLRAGLLHEGLISWWQWVQQEVVWAGPLFSAIRAKGYLYSESLVPDNYYYATDTRKEPFHDYLLAEMFIILFHTGVAQVRVRFINGTVFRIKEYPVMGRPIVAFGQANDSNCTAAGELDGSIVRAGHATIDLDEAQRLTNADQPLSWCRWSDAYGYVCFPKLAVREVAEKSPGGRETWLFADQSNQFPTGMARSTSFTMSLSNATPRIPMRYHVPPWWYAACDDHLTGASLPVIDMDVDMVRRAADRIIKYQVTQGFERGAVAMRATPEGWTEQWAWNGEVAESLAMAYYLTSESKYLNAMLAQVYYFSEVVVNHHFPVVRTHSLWNDISLAYQRTIGLISGYLETGDPFFLELSEGSSSYGYYWHRNNWPRRTLGRDCSPVRGLLQLWRFTDKREFFRFGQQIITDLLAVQHEDGSFSQQGGAGPIHGHNVNVGAWFVGGFVMEVLLEYSNYASDPPLQQAIQTIIQWLHKQELSPGGCWPGICMTLPDGSVPPAMDVVSIYLVKNLSILAHRYGHTNVVAMLARVLNYLNACDDPLAGDVVRVYNVYNTSVAARTWPVFESLMLGATLNGHTLNLSPLAGLIQSHHSCVVKTPYGDATFVFTRKTKGTEILAHVPQPISRVVINNGSDSQPLSSGDTTSAMTRFGGTAAVSLMKVSNSTTETKRE